MQCSLACHVNIIINSSLGVGRLLTIVKCFDHLAIRIMVILWIQGLAESVLKFGELTTIAKATSEDLIVLFYVLNSVIGERHQDRLCIPRSVADVLCHGPCLRPYRTSQYPPLIMSLVREDISVPRGHTVYNTLPQSIQLGRWRTNPFLSLRKMIAD